MHLRWSGSSLRGRKSVYNGLTRANNTYLSFDTFSLHSTNYSMQYIYNDCQTILEYSERKL